MSGFALLPIGLLVLPVLALATIVFQALWNSTLPHAFGIAKQIGFWVAFRLLLMAAMASSGLTLQFGR